MTQYTERCKITRRDVYVADLVTGRQTIDEVRLLKRETADVLAMAVYV